MARYSIEQARRALEATPSNMEGLRAYWIAIAEGKLPEYYLERLVHKKTDYSDELPATDVRALIDSQIPIPTRLTQYKCQGNFVVSLSLDLQGAVEDGVITDDTLKQEVSDFVRSDLEFKVGDLNNPNRISRINTILDRTIFYLTPFGRSST